MRIIIINNMLEQSKISTYYIGYSKDNEDRFKSSSGGIGSAIQRYLLSTNQYGSTLIFSFNKEKCQYEPKIVYSADDLNVCGSVYQDINIVSFVRDNIKYIKNGIVLSCQPCQVTGLRNLLIRNNINNFIISYCCSGQTKIEGTWAYYSMLGINKEDVEYMQYRGNGWPSGIQIKLKNGDKLYHENYTEPWVTMKQSHLFQPKRCFYCKFDTSRNAEISLADPWLPEYKEKEKIGKTMFLINTILGRDIISEMLRKEIIEIEESDYNSFAIAQKPNVEKELRVLEQKQYIKCLIKLIDNQSYWNWATKSKTNMRTHIKIMRIVFRFSTKKNFINSFMNLFSKIKRRLKYYFYRSKLADSKGYIDIRGGVQLNNPQCIYMGKNVGIGEDTYFGPVCEQNGIVYNPKIIIGDNCWIGKHNSFAAIDSIKIGNNVLFAGYVHITDHSHGYEDINRPITPQKLISKGPIVIEDDCWLGFNCEILSGVHIGKHCVVAARAVVTKDVPSYSIIAGNPAKIIKQFNFISKKWDTIK